MKKCTTCQREARFTANGHNYCETHLINRFNEMVEDKYRLIDAVDRLTDEVEAWKTVAMNLSVGGKK